MERKVAAYIPLLNNRHTLYNELIRDSNKNLFKHTKYANPGLVIDFEYVDDYYGRGKNSPLFHLNALMEDCKDGRIGLILTYSCKYFTRNSEEALATVRHLLSLPEPIGIYFEYENIYTLDDPNQAKLKAALAHWDYEQKLRQRKRVLASRIAHKKTITGEGLILELGTKYANTEINLKEGSKQ